MFGILATADPANALEWMVFLAQKYASMFWQGTWVTLYVAVLGTIIGFLLGYVIGIIQDIQINQEDNIIKKTAKRYNRCKNTVFFCGQGFVD